MVNFDNFGGLKSVLKFHICKELEHIRIGSIFLKCEELVLNFHKCDESVPVPHTCEGLVLNFHQCDGSVPNPHTCEKLVPNANTCEKMVQNNNRCEELILTCNHRCQ